MNAIPYEIKTNQELTMGNNQNSKLPDHSLMCLSILLTTFVLVGAMSTGHADTIMTTKPNLNLQYDSYLFSPPTVSTTHTVMLCNPECTTVTNQDALLTAIREKFQVTSNDDDVVIFDDGPGNVTVAFYTTKSHISCLVTWHPIKLNKCHQVHA